MDKEDVHQGVQHSAVHVQSPEQRHPAKDRSLLTWQGMVPTALGCHNCVHSPALLLLTQHIPLL